jgi:hypothetical protein
MSAVQLLVSGPILPLCLRNCRNHEKTTNKKYGRSKSLRLRKTVLINNPHSDVLSILVHEKRIQSEQLLSDGDLASVPE